MCDDICRTICGLRRGWVDDNSWAPFPAYQRADGRGKHGGDLANEVAPSKSNAKDTVLLTTVRRKRYFGLTFRPMPAE